MPTSRGPLRRGLTKKKASPRLGEKQVKRAFRGLSLIRNPYIRLAGVSRRAGADPLLSFHPSRVLSLLAMTGPRSCLLPCTYTHKRPGWPMSVYFGVSLSKKVGLTLSSLPTLMGFLSFSFPPERAPSSEEGGTLAEAFRG